MIYEFFTRIFGGGIASIIYFLPLLLSHEQTGLTVEARLRSPVTDEIKEIVRNDYAFRLEYYFSVIVNDRKTYRGTVMNELTYSEQWNFNGNAISEEEIQKKMGQAGLNFKIPEVRENDEILVFVKAVILPDENFRKSTGMKTRILWNHYVPRIKKEYVFKQGRFVLK